MGVLVALVALSLGSLVGLYAALSATTEVRISDNYESYLRARQAALAGLKHGRELMRGLAFDDVLRGPDGTYDSSASGLAAARRFSFRNPLTWQLAASLDVLDPSKDVLGLTDDGLISTGPGVRSSGTVLIPIMGLPMISAGLTGASGPVLSRYFVKVSDNNGEPSERSGDASDSPYVDGDGVIIVRSLGVARSLREDTVTRVRRNSISVFEARFKRSYALEAPASLLIQASSVLPLGDFMFEGDAFLLQGGNLHPGIGITAPDASIGTSIQADLSASLDPGQASQIRGAGMTPSIRDLGDQLRSDPERSLIMKPPQLHRFLGQSAPRFADSVFEGDQNWNAANLPYLGAYDPSFPWSSDQQSPRVTLVRGDLTISSGNARGAGLLLVTGRLTIRGSFEFDGLIVVAGSGELRLETSSGGIRGGVLLASLLDGAGDIQWGAARLSLSGESVIQHDAPALRMAISLIPVGQIGFREVTPSLDP